jgi:hypothetical protein
LVLETMLGKKENTTETLIDASKTPCEAPTTKIKQIE